MLVPEILVDFACYDGAMRQVGIVNAELPAIEALTETLSGSGIAGEIDTPILGHTGPLSLSLAWRVVTDQVLSLLRPTEQQITLLGAVQYSAPGVGGVITRQLRVWARCRPKNFALGTLAPHALMETSTEFEVNAISIFIDNRPAMMIDKLNNIYMVDGIDYMAKVRVDTGV